MTKIILLAFISMIKLAETSIQDSTLVEHLPDYVHHLGNFLVETSIVIEFGIKLEDQLLGVKSFIEKKLDEHKDDDDETDLTYIRLQLEKQFIEFKSFFEERLAKEIEPYDLSNLKKDITEELNNLNGPFNKRLVGDFAELPDVAEFNEKFKVQFKNLNNFLDKLDSKSSDSFKKSEFKDGFGQKLKEFENILNLLSEKDRAEKSKVLEFLEEIKKLIDELINFLEKSKFNDEYKSSEVRIYGLEIEKQLANMLNILKEPLHGDFKDQPEVLELRNEFDNKIAGVFIFLEENSIDEEKIFVLEAENRLKLEKTKDDNSASSMKLTPRSESTTPTSIENRVSRELQRENAETILSGSQNATSLVAELQTQPESNLQHHVSSRKTSENSLNKDAQDLTSAAEVEDIHTTQLVDTKTTSNYLPNKTSSVIPEKQNSISDLQINVRSTSGKQPTVIVSDAALDSQLNFEPKPPVANVISPNAKYFKEEETFESLNDVEEDTIQESQNQDKRANHMLQGDDPGLFSDLDFAENMAFRSIDENSIRSSTTSYDKIEGRKLKNKRENVKKGPKNEKNISQKGGPVIMRNDKQNINSLEVTGEPKNKDKIDKSLTRKSRDTNKNIEGLNHDSFERNLDNLGDDPNLYSYADKGFNDVYARSVSKDKEKINSKNNEFKNSLSANIGHNNLKKIVSEGIIKNSKRPNNNDHISLENETKNVYDKHQSYANTGDYIRGNTETFVDLVNPRITLNFTISRLIS
ncbi:hypothetical protein NBO_10g0103 [Nosema bombycis CQ1]|uniref:Uncharacterized protein n=1 Tax=Nosema bombycis (strain CQ1 / CVCC 102059) TaxID=578461 RepID=R0MQE8_NOSB1|nr:hypothetical protein NBO_10g0103 [Nosema bombycis CQ1]|eukprot:EOB15113.1 hypothetical protein NBO_10g0103 [Nosema bombycis CQ1]